MEENKELSFVYAAYSATYDNIGDIENCDISTIPIDVYVDIETDKRGRNTSSYCLEFDKETSVNEVFLGKMRQKGFELSFISIAGYKEGNLKVWFKEVS